MSEWANEKHGRDGTTPQCSGPVTYEHLLAFKTGFSFSRSMVPSLFRSCLPSSLLTVSISVSSFSLRVLTLTSAS